MRILLRATYPPPYGGIATALSAAAPWLVERGHELFFLSDSFTDAVERPQPGVTVIRYSSRVRWRTLFRPAVLTKMLPRIARLLRLGLDPRGAVAAALASDVVDEIVRRERIDVVSTYMFRPAFYLAARATRPNVPTVLTVFGDLFDEPGLCSWPRLLRHVLDTADVVLSPSNYCARSVTLVGGDPSPIQILTLGVDIRRFGSAVDAEPLRQRLGLPRDATVVLFLGRFDDEMGIDNALACAPSLLTSHPNAVFVFAGAKGARSEAVRSFVAGWPGRAFMQENAPGAEIPMFLRLASLMIAPTKPGHPCCGMAIKEAMASGIPVVATRTGGHAEVIDDGTTGFLVPLNANGDLDLNALRQRIDALLGDDVVRSTMRRAARHAAERRYDARDTALAMERHFASALERHERAGAEAAAAIPGGGDIVAVG